MAAWVRRRPEVSFLFGWSAGYGRISWLCEEALKEGCLHEFWWGVCSGVWLGEPGVVWPSGRASWGVVSRLSGWVILLAVEVGLCGFNSGQVWSSSLNEWNDWRFISLKKWSCRCKFTCYPAEINIFLTIIKELYQDAYGVVKVSYLSQWIIHSEFINSLTPLKSGFISSIREADWHGSMMLAINNAPRGVFKTLSNS